MCGIGDPLVPPGKGIRIPLLWVTDRICQWVLLGGFGELLFFLPENLILD